MFLKLTLWLILSDWDRLRSNSSSTSRLLSSWLLPWHSVTAQSRPSCLLRISSEWYVDRSPPPIWPAILKTTKAFYWYAIYQLLFCWNDPHWEPSLWPSLISTENPPPDHLWPSLLRTLPLTITTENPPSDHLSSLLRILPLTISHLRSDLAEIP